MAADAFGVVGPDMTKTISFRDPRFMMRSGEPDAVITTSPTTTAARERGPKENCVHTEKATTIQARTTPIPTRARATSAIAEPSPGTVPRLGHRGAALGRPARRAQTSPDQVPAEKASGPCNSKPTDATARALDTILPMFCVLQAEEMTAAGATSERARTPSSTSSR